MALVVTLPLICGSGRVTADLGETLLSGIGYKFQISARSKKTEKVSGGSAVGYYLFDEGYQHYITPPKPIFLNRDEPLADRRYWRTQIIGLDANILPWPNLVKLTALQLAAQMWMAGELKGVELVDPINSLHEVSRDWLSPHGVSGKGWSKQTTTLAIQWHYWRQMHDFAYKHCLHEHYLGLDEWARQLTAFASSEAPRELIGRNDWVTKFYRLSQQADSYQVADEISYKYHLYQLGSSFVYSTPYRRIARFGWPGLQDNMRLAEIRPPATRASARVKFLAALSKLPKRRVKNLYTCDWKRVSYGKKAVTLGDPQRPTSAALDKLIQSFTK